MKHTVRLDRLAKLWPRPPCPDCEARPAVVCVADRETPAPRYPEGVCPRCGRQLFTIPVFVGVECDRL
jgi:hypothetical protein